MKKLGQLSGFLGAMFIASLAHASGQDNDCGKLAIMITNLSPSACTLINQTLKHGYYTYTSSVPTHIPAGTTAGPMILEQSIFGPDLELTYSCGDNTLTTFRSHQDFCFMSAGEVSGQILYRMNTAVDYQTNNGSWLWSQRGSITWRLQ